MAHCIKYLLLKSEDLSSIPRPDVQKQMWWASVIPACGSEMGGSDRISWKLIVSAAVRNKNERERQQQLEGHISQ